MREMNLVNLRTALTYAPLSGEFAWATQKGRQQIGAVAGTQLDTGYVAIRFDGIRYLAHRLAWFYVHGRWPVGEIDHINGVRNDNRICNLRDVTRSENQQNQRSAQITNKAGLLGVSKADCVGYRARLFVSGQEKHLGIFETPEDAHEAYLAAKREHHIGGRL